MLETVYFLDDVGDVRLAIGFQHDNEFAELGFAMDFGTAEAFDILFYGRQTSGTGMHYHARDMNFHRLRTS